jgi:Asp/Glu/hydantoin racemase
MNSDAKPKLGILMLDTQFPRIPGDVGNAETWDFPVAYAIVKGATPQAIVCEDTSPFVEAFVAEGRRLVQSGCVGIATTCGFLAVIRPRLAAQLGVPVAASALEQAAQIKSCLAPRQTLGVLTISKRSLTCPHLEAAGVPEDTHVVGLDGSSFARTILGNEKTLDVPAARAEMVAATRRLLREAPRTGAILLECTNMVPYAADIQAVAGVPVHSIYSYLKWFHEGLRARRFPAP